MNISHYGTISPYAAASADEGQIQWYPLGDPPLSAPTPPEDPTMEEEEIQFDVRLPNGIVIGVPFDFDPDALRRLVGAVT